MQQPRCGACDVPVGLGECVIRFNDSWMLNEQSSWISVVLCTDCDKRRKRLSCPYNMRRRECGLRL
jgi:hypothetical protein